ncbi:hypothetical protein SAMN04488029_1011 [Reichenbachiella faecimaris]|uniref:Uncharacterized protein n=1 Tax=Reichenbachiella faecimaris TaxID=692418 RepID=A0A1W2G7T4_REIFA|nr:hypothetical protein [Reichenbachiella faecimaris]SMD32661.1 hypothetical protein SAMN04488029_1011 [Reichenbachiella faecimaris]
MNLQSILNNCKTEIEQKLQWGAAEQWQNQEFEELSQIIFNKTGVNLSHTTLKRVWGKVKYTNQPSISTLDALAKFLDCPNWSAYKRSQEASPPTKKRKFSMPGSKQSVLLVALIILLSFSSWLFITSNLSHPEALAKQLLFEANYTAMGLPNTVIFSFDASNIEADQLVIQQSWDRRKRIEVNEDQTKATSVYYYPGYFRSKFVADEVVLKEADVYIETDGWLGTINVEPVPIYLTENDLIKSELLALSPSGIEKLAANNKPVSYHYYTAEKSISGDDFKFETSMRYAQSNQTSACKYAKVVLHFSEGAFLIPFVISGCVGEINVLAMDNFISGKQNDLSTLGISLEDWQQIGISSQNKKLMVSIGNKEVLTANYKMDPGYLVGVSYQFDGMGEVDYLKLSNGKSTWQFNEKF